MPTFDRPGVSLHYEEYGSGPPILLIAPGGLRSTIEAWGNAPWNPIEHLSDRYRLIAMDQRNAGGSTGEIHGTDGWHTYTADQLALLDHLGVDEFGVFGMCIGGAFIASLLTTAPRRIHAAVTLQPVGRENNQHDFEKMFDGWHAEIGANHPETSDEDWASFRTNLFGGGGGLFSIDDETLPSIRTPWLILMGGDQFHPESVSRRAAELAPGAELVERWKAPEYIPQGKAAVDAFLASYLT